MPGREGPVRAAGRVCGALRDPRGLRTARRGRGWAGVPEESPLGSCDTEQKCVRGVPWNTSSPGVVHVLPRPERGDRALLSRGIALLLLYARAILS